MDDNDKPMRFKASKWIYDALVGLSAFALAGFISSFVSLVASYAGECLFSIDSNDIIQQYHLKMAIKYVIAATVPAVLAKLWARSTYPHLDDRPTYDEAVDRLRPPFWLKPIIWLVTYRRKRD